MRIVGHTWTSTAPGQKKMISQLVPELEKGGQKGVKVAQNYQNGAILRCDNPADLQVIENIA